MTNFRLSLIFFASMITASLSATGDEIQKSAQDIELPKRAVAAELLLANTAETTPSSSRETSPERILETAAVALTKTKIDASKNTQTPFSCDIHFYQRPHSQKFVKKGFHYTDIAPVAPAEGYPS